MHPLPKATSWHSCFTSWPPQGELISHSADMDRSARYPGPCQDRHTCLVHQRRRIVSLSSTDIWSLPGAPHLSHPPTLFPALTSSHSLRAKHLPLANHLPLTNSYLLQWSVRPLHWTAIHHPSAPFATLYQFAVTPATLC